MAQVKQENRVYRVPMTDKALGEFIRLAMRGKGLFVKEVDSVASAGYNDNQMKRCTAFIHVAIVCPQGESPEAELDSLGYPWEKVGTLQPNQEMLG